MAAAEPEFFPCQGSPHTCLSSPGFKSESDVAPITWDLGYPHATYFFETYDIGVPQQFNIEDSEMN